MLNNAPKGLIPFWEKLLTVSDLMLVWFVVLFNVLNLHFFQLLDVNLAETKVFVILRS